MRPHHPQAVSPHIDDPMALLRACHEKVNRFTALAQRLLAHTQTNGVDDQAREAAQSVLRYFTVAAPLHHADEEEDLFVALRSLDRPDLHARIDSLQAEHETLAARWTPVRAWLQDLAEGRAHPGPEPDVAGFAEHYRAHARAEETDVYPHAAALSPDTLAGMAAHMVARRLPKEE